MAMTTSVDLDERLLLAAQYANECLGKRRQVVEQLTIVHFGEPFGLRLLSPRGIAPTVEDLVFMLLQVVCNICSFSSHRFNSQALSVLIEPCINNRNSSFLKRLKKALCEEYDPSITSANGK
jgi:hypothetical protein